MSTKKCTVDPISRNTSQLGQGGETESSMEASVKALCQYEGTEEFLVKSSPLPVLSNWLERLLHNVIVNVHTARSGKEKRTRAEAKASLLGHEHKKHSWDLALHGRFTGCLKQFFKFV